jgi:hypothetical protein
MAPDYRDQRQWGVPARRAVRHWVRPFCMVLFLTGMKISSRGQGRVRPDTFQDDAVFADMRVAGPNPLAISKLTAPAIPEPALGTITATA